MGREYTEALGEDADHSVYDFWVAPEARGTGLARSAARALLERFPGSWSITVLPANARARAFWEHVIPGGAPPGRPARDAEGLLVYRFEVPASG
jgi:ribosomal protein S18 acetylase RimI-like enzyme